MGRGINELYRNSFFFFSVILPKEKKDRRAGRWRFETLGERQCLVCSWHMTVLIVVRKLFLIHKPSLHVCIYIYIYISLFALYFLFHLFTLPFFFICEGRRLITLITWVEIFERSSY